MAMSGIKVDKEAVELFHDIKMKKKCKFALFKIHESGEKIVIDKTGEKAVTSTVEEDELQWNEMLKLLKPEQARYVIYDFRFTRKSGGICEKIAFFLWSDINTCKVKERMVYASTKEAVKKAFKGFHYEIKSPEMSELEYSEHQKAVEKLH